VSTQPAKSLRVAAGRLLPPGTKRRAVVSRLVDPRGAQDAAAYRKWIEHSEKGTAAPPADEARGPLISVVVPAFNTPDRYLEPMIDSVIAQSYGRWELCLVDGCTEPDRSRAIRRLAARDERIALVSLGGNRGIAGNTNAGLERARGEYIAFLDHDDELAAFALNEVAAAVQADPSIDLLYSDEDRLAGGHRRCLPFFKPAWSPELFFCVNYLAHFVVARAALVQAVGGLRHGYEGAQDYDFLLRTLEYAPRIHHVPRVSYHWRMVKGSTARRPQEKAHAEAAGCRALSDYLARRNISAEVEPGAHITNYRLHYRLAGLPSVHVVAPGPLHSRIAALASQTEGLTMRRLADGEGLESLPASDMLLILEVGGQPHGRQWLKELVSVAGQSGVGMVAPQLHTREGRSAGTGYVADQGLLRPVLPGDALDRWSAFSHEGWARNLVALGGAGVLSVGLARELVRGGASLDVVSLSLAAHRRGLRNVHWPFAGFIASARLQPLPLLEPIEDPYLNPNAVAIAGP
jgi:glycosyltransferase involved in cell wall biosynthesis